MIITPTEGDGFIIEAFRSRFGSIDGARAYAEFCGLLDGVPLPFILGRQMRQLEYPATKGWPDGMPTIFYYFVPNSGWGSEVAFPNDPLATNFVYSTDAMGLNFGCPLRLYFALKRLKTISDPGEILSRLALPQKHLAAVEELLWADVWKGGLTVARAIPPTSGKWFDWSVSGSGLTLNVECKFRPSDWPRLVDGDDFQPITLLNKAADQLPKQKGDALNIVAITGYAGAQPHFLALIEAELETYRHVDAVAYASLAGAISVHSLHQDVCKTVAACFEARRADYFQLFYPIHHHRAQKEARVTLRPPVTLSIPQSLISLDIPHLPTQRTIRRGEDALPYRSNVLSRDPVTNEPKITIIPSHLIVPE